ncbi:PSME3-interacting protein isoform X2 [Synchiropus splendidus]|uniref:PSME3-interacting protein isoform X2 n=1 Tax=Synchiropus splendidus TaxID=270530 RepID=UPI00237D4B32|nr:PSME3-interacting protein isoform X2 [Synchiropus splendidus]
MEGAGSTGVDLSRKFVSQSELDERRKKRQEEWEKVRKPEDPPEAPEEVYDPRSLYERLKEQKDKKQEEFEEQFKFKNMVRGLDDDETSFLDEVSRQQSLVEKQRREEEKKELLEYRISFAVSWSPPLAPDVAADGAEPEKKATHKHSGSEQRSSLLSQAHLLAGAVKRRSSSQTSDGSKKQKMELTTTSGLAEQEAGAARAVEEPNPVPRLMPESHTTALSSSQGVVHLPSAAVCVGVLPGLSAYSGSSDSDSSSDSEV